jgi:UDP-N-acetylglucosamine acyltransferase
MLRTRNVIHDTAIIHPDAMIGSGNLIGPYCVIEANVEIGDYNVFTSHVSIGSPPEHKSLGLNYEQEGVVIKNHNTFREFITVNQGTKTPTLIGSRGYFMRGSHFGHDCQVHDDVTLACNAIIGGHTRVMDFANFGLGAIAHQNIILPPGIMLGAGAVAVKQVYEEWMIYAGVPAVKLKPNVIGLERANITKLRKSELESLYIQHLVEARMTKPHK